MEKRHFKLQLCKFQKYVVHRFATERDDALNGPGVAHLKFFSVFPRVRPHIESITEISFDTLAVRVPTSYLRFVTCVRGSIFKYLEGTTFRSENIQLAYVRIQVLK